MPSVVTMNDGGGPNGIHTDHDREAVVNGLGGTSSAEHEEKGLADGKVVALAPEKPGNMMNGGEVDSRGLEDRRLAESLTTKPVVAHVGSRMNDLPDELVHITQGFVPLSLLLTRLAQTTHNSLQEKIAELAKMPIPSPMVNGNSTPSNSLPDDTSHENLKKKASLLNYIQEQHAKWVQALVITEWSRKSENVSKLIDLKYHIDQQRVIYDDSLDQAINVKRDLSFARMPSPDLRTALQVLSTGSAPWMPDLQYIEPPRLTPTEQAKWIDELNTLLSLRLSLDDYVKIPSQFKDYRISSGRVTFIVEGEFEVDLTIADEDAEKQFWFIDFRFAFSPAASTIPDSLRSFLEGCVNESLSKDGLTGCYNFLHEFVLTSKVNELKRQLLHLNRSSWTGTLQIEPLHRALAIQYWTSRTPPTNPKSWVLLATNSKRARVGQSSSQSASHLVAKWYRDNKEVKDCEVTLNVATLSAESLLRTVIGHHVEFTLTSIRDELLKVPRFKDREAGLILHIDNVDPAASFLTVQIGYADSVSLLMEATTGQFAMKPHSKFTAHFEHQLNSGKQSPQDAATCLENIRCGVMEDTISRRASVMGWQLRKSPLNSEELRSVTKLRDWTRAIWLQRDGWGRTWFAVVFMSLGGDEWWLVDAHREDKAPTAGHASRALRFHTRLPLNKGQPNFSDTFWTNLTFFATGMIAQSVELRELHRLMIKSRPSDTIGWPLPLQIRLPSIEIGLSAMFPTMVYLNAEASSNHTADGESAEMEPLSRPISALYLSPKQPWAKDMITINFKGVQMMTGSAEGAEGDGPPSRQLMCISEAVVKVVSPAKFAGVKGKLDRDVTYVSQTGEFVLRILHPVGEPLLAMLKARLRAVDRFVSFLEALDKAKAYISSKTVALREVSFSYEEESAVVKENDSENPDDDNTSNRWQVVLDLSQDDVDIRLEKGSPHSRIVDMIKRLVNEDGGIGALLAWLPASLPAMKALEKMEREWGTFRAERKGSLDFSMKTMDWIGMRYSLLNSNNGSERRLALEVNMKMRRGEAWWHIWRTDHTAQATSDDEFDAVLKPLWNSKGEKWTGLATGAAAEPKAGVVEMLLAVDDAIRGLLSTAGSTTQPGSQVLTEKSTQQSQSGGKPGSKPAGKKAAGKAGGKTAASEVVVLD